MNTIQSLRAEIRNWKLSRQRFVFLMIGLCSLMLLEFVAKIFYRPYIYSNNIYDFHIADTLGNSLGTVAAVFIVLGLIGGNRNRNHFLINTITISLVVYELAQPLLGKSIDPWDILATVLSGGICFLLYRIIDNKKYLGS